VYAAKGLYREALAEAEKYSELKPRPPYLDCHSGVLGVARKVYEERSGLLPLLPVNLGPLAL